MKVANNFTLRVMREGKIVREETLGGNLPEMRAGDPSELADLRCVPSIKTGFCIYCGSTNQLSREHVVPYALGGTLTITEGSCEVCRKKTHEFETDVLTGPMRMVRYLQNLPSSTKHRSVPKTVELFVKLGEMQQQIELPIEKAPIFLDFYEFGEPKYLEAASRGTSLDVCSVVTGSYGQDPGHVISELSTKGMTIVGAPRRPVAFARMIAKIAYCFAFVQGHIRKLENPSELIDAFMENPNLIGRFVGSIPPPFVKYEGVSIRVAIKALASEGIAYAEVQLFAASGAPTYIVVLGRIRDGEVLS
ncbi:MAG: HNH endonuclease [Nitrospira sp.]|nr:HNH endonuclease [Nitrospira sp.]